MKNKNIIAAQRDGGDWKAHIEDMPEIWESGATANEAIGKLVRLRYNYLHFLRVEVKISTAA